VRPSTLYIVRGGRPSYVAAALQGCASCEHAKSEREGVHEPAEHDRAQHESAEHCAAKAKLASRIVTKKHREHKRHAE
jgi:hypothetical protein